MRILSIALVCLTIFSAQSREGSHTGNGGGSSEANIIYAWENVQKFINVALKSSSAGLVDKDKALLQKIIDSLDEERAQMNIVFKSGAKHPELFELDNQGEARIAMTGDFVGDKIYFNYDRLYPKDDFGVPQPITVIRAVGYLVHEFGHHHNVKDHAYLDQLGAKVMMASRGMVKKVDLSEYQHPFIDVTAYNRALNFVDHLMRRSYFSATPSLADLILADSHELIDLTPSINKRLKCDRLNSPRLKYSYFNNLHWGELEPFDGEAQIQKLTLKGNLNWVCFSKRSFSAQNLRIHTSFELDLFFKVEVDRQSTIWDANPSSWTINKNHKLIHKEHKLHFTKCRFENNYGMSGDCRQLYF